LKAPVEHHVGEEPMDHPLGGIAHIVTQHMVAN
jgi:hypothetical protein